MSPLAQEKALLPQQAEFVVPISRIPEPALNVLVTVAQAAQFLQMPEDWVVDLIKLGSLSCLRSGEERFIRFADVAEYQKEREARLLEEKDDPLDAVRDMINASGLDL